jgi:SRSO17 transposase
MNRRDLRKLDQELTEFIGSMVEGMGRRERREALAAYVTGLLLDGERKSIEPMAARLVDDPAEVQGMRQRLQQAVVVADWADEEMRKRLALKLDAELPGVEALAVDDTGLPKKGEHSVGVARQYSGTLGRIDNCQVATSLHLAGEAGSGCIGMRLFLPETWAGDARRREAAGVPGEVEDQKKREIALNQIDDALRWGVRHHVVLAEAGNGDTTEFRAGLRERGLRYVVGVQGDHRIWPPGVRPRVPAKEPGAPGRPRTRPVGDEEPQRMNQVATALGRDAFSLVRWREGSRGKQSSRFAALWITPAENLMRGRGRPPAEAVWLLIEWPDGEAEPTKFWLASLPKTASLVSLVRLAKLRWRVERDYQELKQEIGLDHYEGRTWRGFHHHATLCAVAHGFLALRRALFPPEDALDAC